MGVLPGGRLRDNLLGGVAVVAIGLTLLDWAAHVDEFAVAGAAGDATAGRVGPDTVRIELRPAALRVLPSEGATRFEGMG